MTRLTKYQKAKKEWFNRNVIDKEVHGYLDLIPELVRMYNIVSDYIDEAFYEHRNRLRHARNCFESVLRGDY